MVKRLLFSDSLKYSAVALVCILVSFCFSDSAYAARRVNSATYGSQSGSATSGTGTSVTYTINLNESGSGTPSNDNITLTWASGSAPTGVTWSFTSGTESVTNGTTSTPTFKPSGNNSTITFTVTTSGSTPAGTYGFTIKIVDKNGGTSNASSSGLSLLVNPPLRILITVRQRTHTRLAQQ